MTPSFKTPWLEGNREGERERDGQIEAVDW